jgi:hypothetical protein
VVIELDNFGVGVSVADVDFTILNHWQLIASNLRQGWPGALGQQHPESA